MKGIKGLGVFGLKQIGATQDVIINHLINFLQVWVDGVNTLMHHHPGTVGIRIHQTINLLESSFLGLHKKVVQKRTFSGKRSLFIAGLKNNIPSQGKKQACSQYDNNQFYPLKTIQQEFGEETLINHSLNISKLYCSNISAQN